MSHSFSPSWTETIRKYAAEAEQLGQLHPGMLDLVYNNNWFNLYVPKEYGGLEKPLPEILRLEENLAKADGSLAWTVTLCSGAAWFAGFLDKHLAKEIFKDPKACFAGSGAVGGTAYKTADGYMINGTWKYASGALHATILTANCLIVDSSGTAILDDNGKELIKSFILKRNEVEILSEWAYFGLIATGSHAFKVDNVLIPNNRLFEINGELQIDIPLLNYPFLQMAETTLAVNYSGMALHFVELVDDYFYTRTGIKRYSGEQVVYFEKEFAELKENFQNVRNQFFAKVDLSWKEFSEKGKCTANTLSSVSKKSRTLAHTARKMVDSLYPYCGLEAAKKASELNRVWRDLHTASQHSLLTFDF
ncbi:Acyl-CoA dehydrogenase type 2 domain protein [Pseudopedobacter saltans DSM 12145]|uniref:Acyl-CoA dehydrogenase type 2 domain protein n=1 Tax=Pseudopedobacter saltans (strain ATCC 51119 / DSM 12145 / JCM 21818 / CCUG 39354 / LMG 10337 / NBRC 100064 / NCIMB 13643) TaxID=762903 RepID=F0S5T0_PSESL|nr:acyl-CoA dehydrogenase [Pseudopedobacter saltans]ADY51001.1 Acyl-CoA dehydrogenase type 2 domain protein [Pseudopedobacter saltans DSM 12145]